VSRANMALKRAWVKALLRMLQGPVTQASMDNVLRVIEANDRQAVLNV